MKTLIVSGMRPYPPRGGSPLRVWQNIRVLASRGPVSVFSFGEREDAVAAIPGVQRWVHVNEDEYPVRELSGIARVWKIFRPRQFPVRNDGVTYELNRRLRAFIAETKPDVIIVSGWTHRIPDAVRTFPRLIVDAHNLESLLQEELLRERHGSLGFVRRLQLLRFRQHERALFRTAARIWVCSREDAAALHRLDSRLTEAIVWPNVVDVEAYAGVRSRSLTVPESVAAPAPTIVFVGSYQYLPNARAAEALIDDVFPRVLARLPQARLLLVGRPPTERMLEAARRDPRIVVTGGVDDVRPYLAAANVSAIALNHGGGTRLKILEAFAAGIPVVSTPKGAEGIEVEDGREIAIATTPERMAQAILDIFARPQEDRRQEAAALALVRESYSLEALRRRLSAALPVPIATTVKDEANVSERDYIGV